MNGNNEEPRPISPDEVELLKKQRDLLLPGVRIAAFDEYAKWLFTIITVVGTLGAAFSNSAFKKLNGTGAILFSISIALIGIALAIAIVLRTVEIGKVNWNSLDDMNSKGLRALLIKSRLAWAAAAFFAAGLLLAGIGPALSGDQSKDSSVSVRSFSYVFGKDGLHATGSIPKAAGTVGQVTVSAIRSKGESTLGNQRTTADRDGVIKFDLTSASIPTDSTAVKIIVFCDFKNNQKQEFQIALDSSAGTSKPSSSGCLD